DVRPINNPGGTGPPTSNLVGVVYSEEFSDDGRKGTHFLILGPGKRRISVVVGSNLLVVGPDTPTHIWIYYDEKGLNGSVGSYMQVKYGNNLRVAQKITGMGSYDESGVWSTPKVLLGNLEEAPGNLGNKIRDWTILCVSHGVVNFMNLKVAVDDTAVETPAPNRNATP
ncbi:MAG: hypothetical protein ACI8X5_001204, partial [Planctomycetota bacterium]